MCALENIIFVEILRIQRLLAYLTYKAMYSPDHGGVSLIDFQNGKLIRGRQFIKGIEV